jgi:hypothetical protein
MSEPPDLKKQFNFSELSNISSSIMLNLKPPKTNKFSEEFYASSYEEKAANRY